MINTNNVSCCLLSSIVTVSDFIKFLEGDNIRILIVKNVFGVTSSIAVKYNLLKYIVTNRSPYVEYDSMSFIEKPKDIRCYDDIVLYIKTL